jgi:virginiamycin B lyase
VTNPGRGITTGPDGNLWYTTGFAGTIGRITPSGVATEFPLVTFGGTFIVTGPDGNLWITGNNNILRFSVAAAGPVSTTTGVVSSLNPSNVGQSVTFTATVTGSGPTGRVQFKDGAGNLGAAVTLSGGSDRFAHCRYALDHGGL